MKPTEDRIEIIHHDDLLYIRDNCAGEGSLVPVHVQTLLGFDYLGIERFHVKEVESGIWRKVSRVDLMDEDGVHVIHWQCVALYHDNTCGVWFTVTEDNVLHLRFGELGGTYGSMSEQNTSSLEALNEFIDFLKQERDSFYGLGDVYNPWSSKTKGLYPTLSVFSNVDDAIAVFNRSIPSGVLGANRNTEAIKDTATKHVEWVRVGDILYVSTNDEQGVVPVTITDDVFGEVIDGTQVYSVENSDGEVSIVPREDLMDSAGNPVLTWKLVSLYDGYRRGTWYVVSDNTIHVRSGRHGDDHYCCFNRKVIGERAFEDLNNWIAMMEVAYSRQDNPVFLPPSPDSIEGLRKKQEENRESLSRQEDMERS